VKKLQIKFKHTNDEVTGYCTFKTYNGDGYIVLSMIDYIIVDLNENTIQVFGHYDVPKIHTPELTIHFNNLMSKDFELFMTSAGTGLVKIVCNFIGGVKNE